MNEITVNLHMHSRYSDGSGLHKDIARAALRRGLDVAVVTDHNVLVRGVEGYYKDGERQVLILVGQEVHDQSRDPQRNHLLVFGANRDLASLAGDPQALINAVREAGGICFLAHPHETSAPLFHEPEIPWEAWDVQGYTGIELWNHLSQLKNVLKSWSQALFHVFFPRMFTSGPEQQTLIKWGELLAGGRHITALGGSDAHALHYRLGPIRKTIFPYDFHFSALNNHLLLDQPLGGDAQTDARQVLHALAIGRGWIGYDLMGSTHGFRFNAQGRDLDAVMGEEIPLTGSVTLQAKLPAPAEIGLWRNGQRIRTWKRATSFVYTASEPGAYRVEVHRLYLGARRGWIYSNPIYLRQ